MISTVQFEHDLLAELPRLRKWCLHLTKRMPSAEDLVQDTLERALKGRASFQAGTNMRAWLCMIARNKFLSDATRAKRMVQMPEGLAEAQAIAANVLDRLELRDVLAVVDTMPAPQQAAIMSVAVGYDYGETAAHVGTALGTVKSRVFRARAFLAAAGMEA